MDQLPTVTFHPEAKALLQKLGKKRIYELSPEERRRANALFAEKFSSCILEYKGTIRDITCSSSNVPVRIYQPEQTEKPILLIFYHGGGYCIGSCDTYHGVCQSLSQLANCVIASVEYRLAPENKFPAAFEDVLACTKWFLSGENRQSVGLPRDAVVGVCGDSAGGCLAAAITHHLKLDTTSIMFQVLIYPGLDMSTVSESVKKYAAGPVIDAKTIKWFHDNYLAEESQKQNPLVSPLLNKSFDGLPPCLLLIAEHDPLHDECLAYKEELEEAGVPVSVTVFEGQIHTFFNHPGLCKESCMKAYSTIAKFVNEQATHCAARQVPDGD